MATETKNAAGIAPDSLLDRNEKLAGAVRRYRLEAESAQKQAKELEKQLKSLEAERDELAKKADTSVAAQKIEELTGRLRTMAHRQAFDAAALKAGAQPAALEDLWTLSGVKAEKDEPDADAIAAVIEAQKSARSWAFGTPPPPPDPNAPPPRKPAPGAGQGAGTTAPSTFTEDQLTDPKFVMQNFERISLAASERLARGEL